MEGRQNMWDPWYLMTLDKPSKVERKFCNMVISYYKDRIFSIWAINMMAVSILVLTYVQKHKHKWSHYLPIMGEFSFWPLDDICVSTPNG